MAQELSDNMRPEETLYLQQVRKLGQALTDALGLKTTKENIFGDNDIGDLIIFKGCDVWRSGDMG